METLSINGLGRTRQETLGGRAYLVAPMTMIVPGVLNGSQGSLYYPSDEVSLNPGIWNGVPIVVYHPQRDGQHVSARDPKILEESGIGTVFADAWNGSKRVAEAWFDVEKTEAYDRKLSDSVRILPRLKANRPIELSTGLHTDNGVADNGANHNGKTYTHVARNYRPDHLAVLPDQKGACSIDDGCGIMVNEAGLCVNCGKDGACAACQAKKGKKKKRTLSDVAMNALLTGPPILNNLVLNAFCATGKGGGRVATCSPKGGSSSSGKGVAKSYKDVPAPGEAGHSKTPKVKSSSSSKGVTKSYMDAPAPGEKGHSKTIKDKVVKATLVKSDKPAGTVIKDKKGNHAIVQKDGSLKAVPTAKAVNIPVAKLAPPIKTKSNKESVPAYGSKEMLARMSSKGRKQMKKAKLVKRVGQ